MSAILRRLEVCALAAALLAGCQPRAVPPVAAVQAPTVRQAPVVAAGLADKVVVRKAERRMILINRGRPIAEYRIALGPAPKGHKRRQGDGRTPEGRYVIDWRNVGSAYHRSLHISYPNALDRVRAAAAGVDPGGMIMIHGLPNGLGRLGHRHLKRDWTNGCIAITNQEIEAIWRRVRDGTPIEILP
jgi:murein L,D-transpeptidase YafK